MARLNDKVIIVTGGSRGIGAGISKTLAEEGAKVALSYTNNKESAEKVLASLPGSGHMVFKLDVSSADSVESGFKEVFSQMGSVYGLVNNAGITKDNLLLRLSQDDFDQVVNTNLRGTFLCTKAVLKPMIKNKAGSIVNITSVVGQMGNPGQANYSASKAGIEAFTKSIAKEVGSRNIRANCVAPGFIVTDMTEALDDKQKEQLVANNALKRLGETSDVANAVVFLLSEEASYITGQTLAVNGGLYM